MQAPDWKIICIYVVGFIVSLLIFGISDSKWRTGCYEDIFNGDLILYALMALVWPFILPVMLFMWFARLIVNFGIFLGDSISNARKQIKKFMSHRSKEKQDLKQA